MNRFNTYLAIALNIFMLGGTLTAQAETIRHREGVYRVIQHEEVMPSDSQLQVHPARYRAEHRRPSVNVGSPEVGKRGVRAGQGSNLLGFRAPHIPLSRILNVERADDGHGLGDPAVATDAYEPSALSTSSPHHDRWRGPHCATWAYGEYLTPARYLAAPARALRQLHRLATCVFRWKAPGYAVPTDIIERESGWWVWAKNPDTATACIVWDVSYVPFGSCGLAQHLARFWPGRVLAFLKPRQFAAWPQISPLDPRANLIVTAAMWRAQGGACPAWC